MSDKPSNFLLLSPDMSDGEETGERVLGLLEEISSGVKSVLNRMDGEGSKQPELSDNYNFALLLSNIFRAREKHLSDELNNLGEPAWNILLELYVCGITGKKVSVSDVSLGASIPGTTSLRYIKLLSDLGLVSRHPSHTDRRITYLTLSDDGEHLMTTTLTKMTGDLS